MFAVQTMKKSTKRVSVKCELGFWSRKGDSCEPCKFDLYGEGCAYQCMCNVTQGCDNVKGCVERYVETTSTLTTKSNIAEAISSEESVTKVHVHKEEQNDGLSKTELLTLFCGALSGIIVLLGFLGISKFVKKRMRMSKSKRDKPSEEEEHTSDAHGTLEAFALHESLYEIIDDSYLDSILVPQTGNPNPGNNDESQSSGSSTNCNDDRSSYLDPFRSPITKKSSCQKEEQSLKTFSSTKISTFIKNQTSCSPYLEKNDESSSSRCSINCNDDQSIYLQPLSSLKTNDISCNTEEQSLNVLASANNSTCIEDRTSCDPYLAIEEDDSDDSSSEFSEDATQDRSSYLHPYNTLFNKTSSCHIYKMCQNEPTSE
ncbi:unnamed protein product [Mytilus coruscus]|uniref:MEGF10_11 n=1 Tax=Mytilus coruscus TaxID=42192 RepID=A0A6J8F358_MYTCO|nr:unnamed protein product [Mytilus coruscus]